MLKSNILTIREFLEREDYLLNYTEAGQNKTERMPKERAYLIPGYQREIRWKKEHAKVLIDDLLEGSKFLGIVLISTKDSKKYEVIDGQQRLTVLHLLIENLKKYSPQTSDIFFTQCPIENATFKQLDDVIEKNFFVNKPKEKKEFGLIDELDQFKTLSMIWKYIDGRLNSLDDGKRKKLVDNLLDSEFNLILSVIGSKKKEDSRVCVDYFIDVNNKNVKLDGMDILKAYAFREDFEVAAKNWIEVQKEVKLLVQDEIPYKKQSVFLHYFISCVNKELGYKLTSIKDDFSIGNTVKSEDDQYPAGTPIEILIRRDGFYTEMFNGLKEYFDFLHLVKNCGGKPDSVFKDKFPKSIAGEKVDNDTIENIYSIINSIIRADEIVPKMLIMKYFFEVVKPKECITKEDLKSIYYIEILAAFFVASSSEKRKVTKQFDRLLLSQDWIKQIKERAISLLQGFPQNISFIKPIKLKNKITAESGQYTARRVFAIVATCKADNKKKEISVQEKLLKNIYDGSGMNVEHFFINRNSTFSAFYGKKKKNRAVVGKIECPSEMNNLIATIGNFLLIDEKVNTSLENHTIYDKINLLEKKFKDGEKKERVFATPDNVKYYNAAKKVFYDESVYPNKELVACEDKDIARNIVLHYYQNDFMDEFQKYISIIAK